MGKVEVMVIKCRVWKEYVDVDKSGHYANWEQVQLSSE
jgi:hypothetical protein